MVFLVFWSGPVWVLPQSTIMTWLSLLWLGLLLVFVRFHCLWLMLWASACVGPHGCLAFSGRCCSFNLGSSSLAWLSGETSTVFLLLCLPSGCGHPLGSLVSFVTIDRQQRFPLEVFFLLGGSLPFRCGVVVSLCPLLVYHAYYWLLTALFPSLSLCLPVPSSPGFLCCFAGCPGCATLL